MPASSSATAIPAPIVPAPITAACSSGRTGVAAVRPSTFPAARSAKNACLSALRLGSLHQLDEGPPLDRQTLVERSGRRLDRLHRAQRCRQQGRCSTQPGPSRLAQQQRARGSTSGRSRARGWGDSAVAGELHASSPGLRRPRGRAAGFPQIGGPYRLAAQDHLDRPRGADQPRQSLGAARARDQPQLHLGQPELRVCAGDSVVRGQRELEAAAETATGDRGDDGLGAVSTSSIS